ncbi:hypothetical protein DFP72DRAFT_459693 [Ephemerocybe angulata]|uniref:Ubiquitin-like domain-containing protein n=1 Tax=Ephemerocybe angulata TaxID=980116 RepID=A0A8H6M3Z8_9AGAR|nr:hypothetical protein DFP72DRAFT_459693 [Tulosesus angulatus]
MRKVLVNPFRSRWKGKKVAVHTEERLEPIAPRIVPPQPSSVNAPHTAPTHPPSEPTLHSTPTEPSPEDGSSSAPTPHPPEATPNFAPTEPTSEPAQVNGRWAPQILCGSSNNSFGSLAITTVQGNMIIHQSDYDELRRAIAAEMRRSIPAIVRHSNENALVLTDALGETLTIPWSFAPTYEELKRLLVNHFRGKLGAHRVAEGRYCIGRAEGSDDGLVVSAEDWVKIRDGCEQLVMSMLIEQELDYELHRMCPKCGRTELGIPL